MPTLNQAIQIRLTDDETDFGTVDFSVLYWEPADNSDEPTGTIDAAQVSVEAQHTVVIEIPVGFLDEQTSDVLSWRFQIMDNETKATWTVYEVAVDKRG
jgi:hypothetical protein